MSFPWPYQRQLDRIEQTLGSMQAQLNKVLGQELSISNKENQIMALVQIEQGDLDTTAAAVEAIAVAIGKIPPGTLPAADETALNQAVADAQAALAAATPAPPTP